MNLSWSERSGRPCLRIEGGALSDLLATAATGQELGRRLAILPRELLDARTAARSLQSVPGTFELDADALYFLPRFPFVDGTSYALLVDAEHVSTIERPSPLRAPVARVVAMYPMTPLVPVNLLRLYIHFSTPMSEGYAMRSVRACRDTGEPLRDVFLDMTPELWDPERTRLTLLLDPGRIKRGLVPNREAGYPLVEGDPIVITVDAGFRDAAGRPLREGATRRYEVGPPLRARVDHLQWQYQYPRAGSLEPLVVQFDRPLDHALLEHSLWVHETTGVPLDGRAAVDAGERAWRFEPLTTWRPGPYVLEIDARLEDIAGNSLIRVFDRDLSRPEDDPGSAIAATIAFTCRPR